MIVARRCESTVAVLRDYNPDYGRWSQHEPLPVGIALLVPAYLPRGRSSAAVVDPWDTSLPPPV